MTKKMLIDATHDEETRVAIVEGNRLEEFEYESKFRKPLKGSIFLAKVTRVEPSLQACFVNFGGNRHGFLPFSEIHPDYFRIPIADREALMAEQEELLRQHEEAEKKAEEAEKNAEEGVEPEVAVKKENKKPAKDVVDDKEAAKAAPEEEEAPKKKKGRLTKKEKEEALAKEKESEESKGKKADAAGGNVQEDIESAIDESIGNCAAPSEEDQAISDVDGNIAASEEDGNSNNRNNNNNRGGRGRGRGGRNRGGRGRMANNSRRSAEMVGGEEFMSEKQFRFNLRRKYKIQEVVKRGQIMLIQVSKEERGNKGAAVSTYLSLPGRYCVLMPNSPRGGGVSRKIASYKERSRMKEVLSELETPKEMSVIVRTAGVSRTKAEVKRDFDYLMRLWGNIRGDTLKASAPEMIYQEADLIKRAVRDLYTRDVEDIQVAGEDAYNNAKELMKMMIPSHVKKVKRYDDKAVPLFNRFQVEGQINEIGEPTVRLKSGGYLVINPTEALISVDVNSGKATKERHIEETAVKTNLEAADEVARQLRLRDLGGLVVIDFIDMEDRRNNAKVERRLKEALSGDRARVQVGRISSFGLLELSRQRLNASLTEAQFETCTHCHGVGMTRSSDAMSIMVLRAIEEEGLRARAAQIIVHVSTNVALYMLNNKKANLVESESRYGFSILIRVEDALGPSDYRIEVSKPLSDESASKEGEEEGTSSEQSSDKNQGNSRKRGRRGGRNRNNNRSPDSQAQESAKEVAEDVMVAPIENSEEPKAQEVKEKPKRGRKPAVKKADVETVAQEPKAEEAKVEETKEKPKRGRKPAVKKVDTEEPKAQEVKEKPKAATKKKASNDSAKAKKKDEAPKDYETVNEAPTKKKRGWWSKD